MQQGPAAEALARALFVSRQVSADSIRDFREATSGPAGPDLTLSAAECEVLLALREGAASASEVARERDMDDATVRRCLLNLDRRMYRGHPILETLDAEDSRVRNRRLTPAGEALVRTVAGRYIKPLARRRKR